MWEACEGEKKYRIRMTSEGIRSDRGQCVGRKDSLLFLQVCHYTNVDSQSLGRQDPCPKISNDNLEGCPDNALENASELRLFQGLDTRITPEKCPKIPSTRPQEKF